MDRSIENLFIWNESRAVVNDIYTMMNVCKDYLNFPPNSHRLIDS